MKTFYATCAILGAALPYSQLAVWLGERGLDVGAFAAAVFSSRISAFAWLDVLVSAIVLIALIVVEGRRLEIPFLWLPILATLGVGVSCGLPLFLLMRQARLERGAAGEPPDPGTKPRPAVALYDASYANFASTLYQKIREEAFGEDLGQNSWLTASELRKFTDWLRLGPGQRLLDVACGSGGPSVRLAKVTGCGVVGIDIHEQATANANTLARREWLAGRATFERLDAGRPLPWPPASFDAVICIDAINHLPDRRSLLAEWARLLKPGGRLLFTDPIVVTGPLSHSEIAVRSSAGFYLFVPPGEDERLVRAAGFELDTVEDVTDNMAEIARRRGAARAAHAAELRAIEGDATFDAQQEFFRVSEMIARERRLSRFAFLARKPLEG